MLTWDESKAAANFAKHGVSFDAARQFDWDTAIVVADTRRDYGESRHKAAGYVGPRLFVPVFAERGDDVRVISVRKANRREVKRYAETKA